MKKVMLAFLVVAVATTLAMAGTPRDLTNVIPDKDVFGAHLNGGRGCAACHAPHGGARGGGNYTGDGLGVGARGDSALWGTDVTPLIGRTLSFAGYDMTIGTATTGWDDPLFKHVGTCLSCHDGNVSTGAMMNGWLWEQNLLPSSYSNSNVHLYGTQPIPTLLGNDGSAGNGYENDHPVGPAANIYAVVGSTYWGNTGNYQFYVSAKSTTSSSVSVRTPDAGTAFARFIANYGVPAVAALRVNTGHAAGEAKDAFVVCTTCHQQHNNFIYKTGGRSQPIAGDNTGIQLKTYFFVKGPYNPGANYDSTHAPSTMQFCRQCHFSMSNEAYGSDNVGTAF